MLVTCSECGTRVSSLADECYNCGFPIKKYKKELVEKEELIKFNYAKEIISKTEKLLSSFSGEELDESHKEIHIAVNKLKRVYKLKDLSKVEIEKSNLEHVLENKLQAYIGRRYEISDKTFRDVYEGSTYSRDEVAKNVHYKVRESISRDRDLSVFDLTKDFISKHLLDDKKLEAFREEAIKEENERLEKEDIHRREYEAKKAKDELKGCVGQTGCLIEIIIWTAIANTYAYNESLGVVFIFYIFIRICVWLWIKL